MATPTRSIVDRMKGAALLDVPTYEEVEADTTATGQAAIVVVISAIASAIGALGRGGDGHVGRTAPYPRLRASARRVHDPRHHPRPRRHRPVRRLGLGTRRRHHRH